MALSPLAILRRHWFPSLPADHCGPALGGGFSGSPVVAVRTPAGIGAVLKAFAPGTSLERAAWIHGFKAHLTGSGVASVPRVLETVDRRTLAVDADGTLWELATRMPGAAIDRPTDDEVSAAMAALARLHVASGGWAREPPRVGPAPAIERRVAAARELLADPWDRPSRTPGDGDPLRDRIAERRRAAGRLIDAARWRRVVGAVSAIMPVPTPLQAVVRDLRADHVLFTTAPPPRAEPATVSGIVDFHGAAIDTPATDIARLLGDWVMSAGGAGWGDRWESALDAYERVRPLRADQRALVPWLATTAVVFGLDRWFRWVLVEQRSFPESVLVEARIDRLLNRIPAAFDLLENLAPPRPNAGGESV